MSFIWLDKGVYLLSGNQNTLKIAPFLAGALTHIHTGAGRSPGAVDLPVIKDSLGYYFIPGSSMKGSIKSTLGRMKKCIDRSGKIACENSNCSKICCLLGGETTEGVEAPSKISITDAYPFLIPLPSLDAGIVFATSPMLLGKIATLLDVSESTSTSNLKKDIKFLMEKASVARERKYVYISNIQCDCPYILNSKPESCIVEKPNNVLQNLVKKLQEINKVYQALKIEERILIVPEEHMRLLIEKSLVRVTRIRLDRNTKTVAEHALWTEEYIPHLTLFFGAFVDTGTHSKYCESSKIQDAFKELQALLDVRQDVFEIIIGGKETVGKGIMRILL